MVKKKGKKEKKGGINKTEGRRKKNIHDRHERLRVLLHESTFQTREAGEARFE